MAAQRGLRAEFRGDLSRNAVSRSVDDRDAARGELVAVEVGGAAGHERACCDAGGAVDLLPALALGLHRQRTGVDDVNVGAFGGRLDVPGVA